MSFEVRETGPAEAVKKWCGKNRRKPHSRRVFFFFYFKKSNLYRKKTQQRKPALTLRFRRPWEINSIFINFLLNIFLATSWSDSFSVTTVICLICGLIVGFIVGVIAVFLAQRYHNRWVIIFFDLNQYQKINVILSLINNVLTSLKIYYFKSHSSTQCCFKIHQRHL